ncbi:hypothetical protein J1C67_16750 [Clostridium gasigenes]|uniref:DUF6897 domain-containing protein n=1 Tax=Clostridium gasigenes TaxID=94869 RepID=UPI00143864F8|nr:hypothetical protein [Clostridium gasigenes]NKF05731.1 hypothetical protein [Clostridium gasigenes]QSW19164.1 hypothetical protein J1C67_16750 [Clostridium gasigenes]
MNTAIYICIFICYVMAVRKEKEWQKYIIKKIKKKKEGVIEMNEIIKNFIGKECLIYTFRAQISGVIESLENNWISIKTGNSSEIINIDYISRIREYPKNKKGKKKSFIID